MPQLLKGKPVFLSSHILAEVELLCDHIGIIRQGKIVESGSLEQLRLIGSYIICALAGFTILAVFILVFGWLPRFSVGICCGIYGLFIVTELCWEMGAVPWSVMQLTPLAYAHYSIPVMEISIIAQIVLLIISLVLIYIGYVGLKKRDCIM